jgi:serine/threonine protein kinase
LIREFEAAWLCGRNPAVGDYLQAAGDVRRPLLVELIHVDLEFRLKAGQPVRVESYVADHPELAGDPAELVELIVTEFRLRRRKEQGIGVEEYARRFPSLKQVLEEQLASATRESGPPRTDRASGISTASSAIRRTEVNRVVPKLSHQDDLFEEQVFQTRVATDRAFAIVLGLEWICAVVLALIVSPLAWEGASYFIHEHVLAALFLGGIIALPAGLAAWFRSGSWWTRHMVATAQTLMAALYIHLTHGRIETHFMIFGSLAFLAFYRDWKVLINASLVVFLDHALRGILFPESVYGVVVAPIWRSFEHLWWVVFENVFLIYAIARANRVQSSVARQKLGEMGQYVLQEKLGSGGMGDVFLAEHRLLKRPCAIKLIRSDLAREKAALARFEREVRTMAQLRHQNTVSIYDFGHLEDGTFFYVMEHLVGLNLHQLVERHGPLPAPRVVYLLRQVCGALAEAHGIGFIHRDVKPDNILVCRLGGQHDVAKLCDFGLVRMVRDDESSAQLTRAGSFLGTPHYMSPEQVTGEDVDHRSDLFSLGAVAFYLLTGKPPFDGPNPLAIMYARVKEPLTRTTRYRADVPRDLERIVLRCLAQNPHERFASATSLLRELAQCACARDWDDEQATSWWQQFAGDSAYQSSIVPTEQVHSETLHHRDRAVQRV